MPRPKSITHELIVKVLEQLRKKRDIPARRESKKYDLIYKGERYPPKYVLSLVNRLVPPNARLRHSRGGRRTNDFLESRDFKLVPKAAGSPGPPGGVTGKIAKHGGVPKPRSTSAITLSRILDPQQLDYRRRTATEVGVARRLEAALVVEYRDWLKRDNCDVSVANYQGLRCDAYEKKRNNLIEAKSSNKREYIRMAVGQLLDYRFLGREKFNDPHMAILLRRKPEPGILTWLDELKIKVIWKQRKAFKDNAGGLFI
jgi:hypothetical protein